MKLLVWLLLVAVTSVYASPNVTVYFETTADGYDVFADNTEGCPVTVQLDLTLENLESEKGDHAIIIVPAKAEYFQINTLKIISKLQAHQFSHIVTSYFGDSNKKEYDAVFEYALPFKKGGSYKLLQPTNTNTGQEKEFAINFEMPLGTVITAVRGGLVIEVVAENEKGCREEDCNDVKNYILVYHIDGTFAEYSSLKKEGILVAKGDPVKIGQPVGLSDVAGRANRPKLHLEIFLADVSKRKILKTNFLLGNGSDYGILLEGATYTRNY
ncbi:M23 family metallopeptidase [Cochleicola gelatinilyticus]|uniref:M23ase beta-sheet core domain-containing protein n=1 Tax=Cochleicola gelatinilyticus TaxID=1763537 RepID=A0A167EXZ9_9FLAO|nr:M23 family metallopeptidase [Cochleicola gelatinilyticus]OAB75991.1 hypothetical protein ULVI_13070 [Cochleicola gelatinilyticus]